MRLIVKDLSVAFRKNKVLKNISFSIEPGVYGLIGENGAGKTTLFRSILGLQKHSGEVVNDEIWNVGYVPQKFDSLHGLNLEETLMYFCCLHKIPKSKRKQLAADLLEKVNLTEETKKKVGELSGGMLRRLGIAQALVSEPELLIMDEPTVGLDPMERVRLREILEDVRENRIIIISSHEIHELEHLCEKMIFLHKGELVCFDTLAHLCEHFSTTDLEEIYFKVMRGVS